MRSVLWGFACLWLFASSVSHAVSPFGQSTLRIVGDGFFILDEEAPHCFRRVVSARRDLNGVLVDTDDRPILGFGLTASGHPNGALGPIALNFVSSFDPNTGQSGALDGFNFRIDGFIDGLFTNGAIVSLAQIAVAQFQDPLRSEIVDGCYFATDLTGPIVISSPAQSGAGEILADAPESCELSLELCLAIGGRDADGDGEGDATDRCPNSVVAEVDGNGCTLSQFCSAVDTSTKRGRESCRASDWMNDEPVSKTPKDCRVNRNEVTRERLCKAAASEPGS